MHSFEKGDEGVFIIRNGCIMGPGRITSLLRKKAGGARVLLAGWGRVVEVNEGDLFRSEVHARVALADRLENIARHHRRVAKSIGERSREARLKRAYEDMEFDDMEAASGIPTTAAERALHEARR